jgi:hypothetical protein
MIREGEMTFQDGEGHKNAQNTPKEKRRRKMNLKVVLSIVAIAVFAISCEELEYNAPADQPVWFEYNYVNHAWGYQNSGWFIDREGTMRYYNLPESYRLPDSSGYMSLEDLEHNLSLADSIVLQVDSIILEKQIRLIPGAAEGALGDAENIAADAGSSTLSCYIYNDDLDVYRKVKLAQSGDWEQFNLSREAEKLVKWLREFDIFWLSD